MSGKRMTPRPGESDLIASLPTQTAQRLPRRLPGVRSLGARALSVCRVDLHDSITQVAVTFPGGHFLQRKWEGDPGAKQAWGQGRAMEWEEHQLCCLWGLPFLPEPQFAHLLSGANDPWP